MTTFIHLQASCLTVLKICRQIYVEAHLVFYARTSYYTANEKEFEQLVNACSLPSHSKFRSNAVTSLMFERCLYYTDRDSCCLRFGQPFMSSQFEGWESLRKINLCMRVGEEFGYIDFLFCLPGMARDVMIFWMNLIR